MEQKERQILIDILSRFKVMVRGTCFTVMKDGLHDVTVRFAQVKDFHYNNNDDFVIVLKPNEFATNPVLTLFAKGGFTLEYNKPRKTSNPL